MTTTIRRTRSDDDPARANETRDTSQTDVATDDIARRAYEHYEERGRQPGHEMDDWLQAERELRPRHSEE